MHSVQGYDHVVRKVKIFFHLEDATIKVVEPKVDNSGIAQGKSSFNRVISASTISADVKARDFCVDVFQFESHCSVLFF